MITQHSVFFSTVYVQSQNKKYIKAFNNSMLSLYIYIYIHIYICKENIGSFFTVCVQRFMYVLENTSAIFLENKTYYFAIKNEK